VTGPGLFTTRKEMGMKITVWVKTGKVGSRSEISFEVDSEEWNTMPELKRYDICREELFGVIAWGFEEEDV